MSGYRGLYPEFQPNQRSWLDVGEGHTLYYESVGTPLTSAWVLKKGWPEAELLMVGDAGHSASEPGMIDGLVRATGKFARGIA